MSKFCMLLDSLTLTFRPLNDLIPITNPLHSYRHVHVNAVFKNPLILV